MLDIIKKAAVAAMDAAGPVQLLEATVLTPPPALSIQIGLDTKNPIPSSLIMVAEYLTKHVRQVRIATSEDTLDASPDQFVRFEDELQAGDKVVIISVQGGQSFYIAGKGVIYGADS